jgi:hypothetical protein
LKHPQFLFLCLSAQSSVLYKLLLLREPVPGLILNSDPGGLFGFKAGILF